MKSQTLSIVVLLSFLCSPSLSNEIVGDIRALRKAIESEKIDVFVIDSVKKRCSIVLPFYYNHDKNFYKDKDFSEFRYLGGFGKIFDDGRIEIPWELEVIFDNKKIRNIVEYCSIPKGGKRQTAFDRSYKTKSNIPYAWQTKLTNGYCGKTAYYTSCSTQCLQTVPSGAPVFAFVLTKKIAEEISKTNCFSGH